MRVQVISSANDGEQLAEFETDNPWVLFDAENIEVRDELKSIERIYPSLDSTFKATPEMVLKVMIL